MRETGLGEKGHQEEVCLHSGREGNGDKGREKTTLESSQAARLCREKGDQVSVSAERGAGRILEAEFMKNRDLAQLGSNVFMNGMGGIPSLCFWRSSTLSLSP